LRNSKRNCFFIKVPAESLDKKGVGILMPIFCENRGKKDIATENETMENTQDVQTAPEQTDSEESNIVEDSGQEQPPVSAEATDAGEVTDQAETEQVPDGTVGSENASVEQNNTQEPQVLDLEASADKKDAVQNSDASDVPAEKTAAVVETSRESVADKIFEAIQEMARSPSTVRDRSATAKKTTPGAGGKLFELSASNIMQNQVTWAGPDESIQQALATMQQTDAGYIMVGRNGRLEGIVSKSDITRALSPYLQPIFAKWRRPLDDATLKIRIKWIMSRPVRTIKPETSLAAIMEFMNQFRGRCLAVTDEQNNVYGLVTAFDIFKALLKEDPFCTNITKREPENESNTYPEDGKTQPLVESVAEAETT
jgi:CBS domain-containing protein